MVQVAPNWRMMHDKSEKVHSSTGCVTHDCAPLSMHTETNGAADMSSDVPLRM